MRLLKYNPQQGKMLKHVPRENNERENRELHEEDG